VHSLSLVKDGRYRASSSLRIIAKDGRYNNHHSPPKDSTSLFTNNKRKFTVEAVYEIHPCASKMPFKKLKSKLFPYTSSTTTSTVHGIPQLKASPEDPSSPPTYTQKKKWVSRMPKEPFADPSQTTAPQKMDKMSALSDEERKMIKEQGARAEEGRKAVRASLRDGKDASRNSAMGSGFWRETCWDCTSLQ
jgi:hypothetical protein